MLTEEAIKERMWGSYPALRQVLENQPIPKQYKTIMSTDDTIFGEAQRALEQAILFKDNQDAVVRHALPDSSYSDPVDAELNHLASSLRYWRSFFDEAARCVALTRAKRHSLIAHKGCKSEDNDSKPDDASPFGTGREDVVWLLWHLPISHGSYSDALYDAEHQASDQIHFAASEISRMKDGLITDEAALVLELLRTLECFGRESALAAKLFLRENDSWLKEPDSEPDDH
jgi:hypothetical protein